MARVVEGHVHARERSLDGVDVRSVEVHESRERGREFGGGVPRGRAAHVAVKHAPKRIIVVEDDGVVVFDARSAPLDVA